MRICNYANWSYPPPISTSLQFLSGANDDVVNRNKDELDEESDESHHYETDRCTESHLRELFTIGFVTTLDEADAVLGEVSQRIYHVVKGAL